MRSVHDVASYILSRSGPMGSFKLHRLAYYAGAWHLAWEEEKLFAARVEAWAAGPAIPELYRHHKGVYLLEEWPLGNPDSPSESEMASVDAVLASYGSWEDYDLSALAQSERPWLSARAGLSPSERGSNPIPPEEMRAYYQEMLEEGVPVARRIYSCL